ncbi:MAG TPA: DNA polymerase III subunit gamma/tau [Thermoanaerobaculia bacterium]|jgi:DNA polymerase-3 subunit gamma/tau|nr:DNA polymerase III subunit gamma/tau [Thermoanaerobaculia bacterium]
MAYQVLARKWRPQSFSSLVGQESIVTALRNALQEGRIAQAYLFSGIRGVGKTTAARVLAKALNCERGPASDPCNECTSCIEITRGSDLDVIEVDAATYSKVEQVRELTESLKYGPARDRYKVVVLDEIHRLSRQAFDALLKIVEEPPRHLVFIFATTEIDAVPATILSRCQEFNFRRVPSHQLAAYLRTITEAEGIQASDTALRLIARAGEGSVRDSVALLDQLATFGSGSIADEDTVRLLGGLDTALFQTLLAGILAGDAQAVAAAVHRVEEEGWDPRHVYGQFLAFARDALHLAMGGSPEQVDLPLEEAQLLAATAKASGYENLLRLLNQLLTSENVVRRSDTGALAVEIAWLRAAELPKLTRVEEILAGTWQPGAAPAVARPAAAAPRPAPAPAPRSAAPDPAPRSATPPAPARPAPVQEPPSPAPPPAVSTTPATSAPSRQAAPVAAPARSSDPMRAFLDEVSKRRPHLAGYLEGAENLRFDDGRLTILALPGDNILRSRLQQDANRQAVEESLAAVWGPGTAWRLAEGPGKAPAAPATAAPRSEAPAENPAVQTVLEIFGGRVETIQEHGTYTED